MLRTSRLAAVLITLLPFAAHAGPGDFDTTLLNSGKAAYGFDLAGGTKDDRAYTVIPGATTIMMIGLIKPDAANGAARVGFMRVQANGVLDSTFGTQGRVSSETSLSTIVGAGMDNSGRIYIAGTYFDAQNGDAEFGVQRYLANGQPDLGYGLFGLTVAAFDQGGSNADVPRAIAVSASGAVIVAGSVQFTTPADTDFGIARFTVDGQLDTAFSSDGKTTVSFDVDGLAADEATALSTYDPNTMRVVGTARRADGSRVVAVASFITSNGALTPAFCSSNSCVGAQQSLVTGPGRRTLRFDTLSGATDDLVTGAALASDASGRLGIAGISSMFTGTPSPRAAFALVNSNGQMPATFQRGAAPEGSNNFGRVLFGPLDPTYALGVIHRNADDHWILTGTMGNSPTRYGFALYINSLPAVDTGFTQIDFGGGPQPSAFQLIEFPRNADAVPIETVMSSVAIDAQQRIVMAGWRLWNRSSGVEDNDFAIVRLSASTGADAVFANGFE